MHTYRGYKIVYTRLGEGDIRVDVSMEGQPYTVTFFRETLRECEREAHKFVDSVTTVEQGGPKPDPRVREEDALLRVQGKLLEARDLARELGLEKPVLNELLIDAIQSTMEELAFMGCDFDNNPYYHIPKET